MIAVGTAPYGFVKIAYARRLRSRLDFYSRESKFGLARHILGTRQGR
jgi:hypothetical protein